MKKPQFVCTIENLDSLGICDRSFWTLLHGFDEDELITVNQDTLTRYVRAMRETRSVKSCQINELFVEDMMELMRIFQTKAVKDEEEFEFRQKLNTIFGKLYRYHPDDEDNEEDVVLNVWNIIYDFPYQFVENKKEMELQP